MDSSTTTQMAKIHGPVWKTQSFLLSEICMVIPLAGLLWERAIEKVLLKHGWEKIPNWECLLFIVKKIILICVCGRHKLAGKKHNIDPMWKVLNKEVDLGEPTSFLIMYTWDAFNDNAK